MRKRDPGVEKLLTQMSSHLLRIAAATSDLIVQPIGPESPAHQLANSGILLGMGARRPGLEAAALPPVFLSHATDHLRAIAAVIDAEHTVFAMFSLVRPTLESTAAAFYLLDPEIDDRERVRRWANVTIESDVEKLRLMDQETRRYGLGLEIGNRMNRMLRQAEQQGFDVKRPKATGWLEPMRWLEPQWPRDQALLTDLLDDVTDGMGRMVHRVTSAVAHGSLHGITMFIVHEQVEDIGGGMTHAPMGLTTGAHALWTAPVLTGLSRCVRRAAPFYGWDTRRWEKVTRKALEDWRDWNREA